MKSYLIIIFGLIFCSCVQTTKSESTEKVEELVSSLQPENISNRKTAFGIADIEHKVFEIGNKTHFTDTCSFYFECDCCSGELLFNSDSTFFYLDYCMSDQTARKGTYEMENGQLKLKYGAECVSRKYNYENEIDSSAVDFFMTDSVLNEISIAYSLSICNYKLLLSDQENDDMAIEVKSSYTDNIEYLRKEGFIERFEKLKNKN